MGNEASEEELSQNVCNLERYAEEKVWLSSKKRTVNVLSTGCLLSGFFVFVLKVPLIYLRDDLEGGDFVP